MCSEQSGAIAFTGATAGATAGVTVAAFIGAGVANGLGANGLKNENIFIMFKHPLLFLYQHSSRPPSVFDIRIVLITP